MAKIIENMPSGDSCLASLPSAHEMQVSQEVIVPLVSQNDWGTFGTCDQCDAESFVRLTCEPYAEDRYRTMSPDKSNWCEECYDKSCEDVDE